MTHRLSQLKNWLIEKQYAFTFLSEPKNVFYFTNFMCDPHERLLGLVVFPHQDPFLVCPNMEKSQAEQAGWQYDIIGYEDHENPWTPVIRRIQERIEGESLKAAIEMNTLPYRHGLNLKACAENLQFYPAEPGVDQLRNIKDEQELKSLRKAAELADFAISVGAGAIKKGKTEQALIAEIEYELKKRGCEGMSFATTVLAGDKSAAPHGNPGDRQIREGDFVLFDLGVIVDGYCSDITRTFVYKHASDEQRKIYDTVLQAEEAAIAAAQNGAIIGDVDRTARQIIDQAGYGKYFTHRIGHGLGLGIHEAPSMSSDNTNHLKTGMVFTIEPGIYVPDIGGVRIEDDVYIGENGPECLTKYPKELQIIE
ncbi:Xaa-Pro dipeptidase [Pullulanibacillus pueri]|uniref:Putative dipeptidase YkvY n=1 Tax=Pullulanibacillus pueri TaxID=1437324 RepID=A0A8J3EPH1_9BACL|nr:Xaa-Pro peptidase family protein [Pullulanibacillus pueri]MBM7683495.1 Xaa-Pro dipeptidase [Pullulanibacillus pueri]GGH86696.1 putative dipeptidase YkvY [Pullulanibacillus pueri]